MIIYDHIGHMVSTTNADELHSFARSIGLKRNWYQRKGHWHAAGVYAGDYHQEHHDHYDLTTFRIMNKAKRYGAVMVDPKDLIKRAWWARPC